MSDAFEDDGNRKVTMEELEQLTIDVLGLKSETWDEIEYYINDVIASGIVQPDQWIKAAVIGYELWRYENGAHHLSESQRPTSVH